MKKSVSILLLLAVLTFYISPTSAMTISASNPTIMSDKHPKAQKPKKDHHKDPAPPHKDPHKKPAPPHKEYAPRPPKRPMPPVGTHYRERPQHCIRISFNHAPYFFAEGIFYRFVNTGYVVVRPQIGMIIPFLPETDVYKVKRKGETLYVCNDVLYKPFRANGKKQFKIVGFISLD